MNLAMKLILVVAIVSIVSAVVIGALLVIPPPVGSTCCEPNVALASRDPVGQVMVAGVSETRDLENFKAILLKNGTVEDEMDPLMDDMFTTHMFFIDLDGLGTLSVGDYFIVTCDPGSSYELLIVWKDSGNVRGSEEWET